MKRRIRVSFTAWTLLAVAALIGCGGSGSSGTSGSNSGGGGSSTPADLSTSTLSAVTFKRPFVVSGNASTGTVVAASAAPAGGLVVFAFQQQQCCIRPSIGHDCRWADERDFLGRLGQCGSCNARNNYCFFGEFSLITFDRECCCNGHLGRGTGGSDTKADLLCWTGIGGGWAAVLSTGSGWNGAIWSGGPAPVYEWNVIPVGNQCFSADFTGDKKTDLSCSNGVDGNWTVGVSTGTAWNKSVWSGGPVVPLPMTQQCVTGDFNGDAKADLVCWTGEAGGWAVVSLIGAGWQGGIWSGGTTPVYEWNIYPVSRQCFTWDFDGDGITDLACYSGSNGAWNVALSSGTAW